MVQMSHVRPVIEHLHRLTAINFDMPSEQAQDKSASERQFAMHIEIDEGIRSVLIVEDEMIVAMLMEDLLRSLGVEDVYICADAASALEVVRSSPIDCAVLDLRVRDGSSTEVADALAEKGIPFVFSSGTELGEIDARHAGRPMISKPFLDDDFRLVVLDTWTLARSQQASSRRASPRVATSGATD